MSDARTVLERMASEPDAWVRRALARQLTAAQAAERMASEPDAWVRWALAGRLTPAQAAERTRDV